jgi:DNA-binding response OmpR family regulator
MTNSEKHVLIIDDDQDDCDLFCDAVKHIDASVQCEQVLSAKGAFKLLNEVDYKPDFIFLDLNLPMFDGKKCISEFKKIDALKDVPIIVYTTSKRTLDIDETRALGAVHFITKPNTFTELCAEIIFVLERKWAA